MLANVLKNKNMSIYRCAKQSGVPYTTLSEVVRGKTRIEKCSAETVYRLSKVLNLSMEELLKSSLEQRVDFEIFKSNVCHRVKDGDELDFIITTLQNDEISKYWNKKWYPEAFYLLAMLDYLSRVNHVPICNNYNDIRRGKLQRPIYPSNVIILCQTMQSDAPKEECLRLAIPEFLRFNIVESEVRNVC